MNPARAAAAYEKIAEGFAELALAVGEPATQVAPLPPFEEPDLPFDEPRGSEAVCPAHNIRYLEGKFGPYCPSLSDDPEWSNRKGYCSITPKNAAVWLRKHA